MGIEGLVIMVVYAMNCIVIGTVCEAAWHASQIDCRAQPRIVVYAVQVHFAEPRRDTCDIRFMSVFLMTVTSWAPPC